MALSGERREGPREKHYLFTTLHIVPSTRQRLISHTSHTDNLFLYHVSSHFHTYFPPLSSPILVCFGWTMKVGGGPYSLSQPHCLFLAQLYIHMRLRILLRFDASLDRQTHNTHTHSQTNISLDRMQNFSLAPWHVWRENCRHPLINITTLQHTLSRLCT